MPVYRLYVLDGPNGQIRNFKEFEARSDGNAVQISADLAGADPMELWCERRRVRQFHPVIGPFADARAYRDPSSEKRETVWSAAPTRE